MRKILSLFTTILMVVSAMSFAAPDANAWTARELWESYDFGVEQVQG